MASIVKIPFRYISVQLVFDEAPSTVFRPGGQRWTFDIPEIYEYLEERGIRDVTFITTTEDKSFALRFEDDDEAVLFRLKFSS